MLFRSTINAARISITSSRVTDLADSATTSVASIRSGTSASDVGLGSVHNSDTRLSTQFSSSTSITAGLISLGASSGARIVLDATSSAPKIEVYDS